MTECRHKWRQWDEVDSTGAMITTEVCSRCKRRRLTGKSVKAEYYTKKWRHDSYEQNDEAI